MALLQLSAKEQQALRQMVRQAPEAKLVKRAQALLWLADGEASTTVAQRQEVSRQTLYNWVHRFQENPAEAVPERLQESPRAGRPPTKGAVVATLIEEVRGTDPRQFGYPSPVWTTPLLRGHLKREKGLEVCARTVRRVLRRQDYGYKRPRYTLARRRPTWRQEKGG